MLLVGDYEGDSPLSNMLPNESQFLLSELLNRIRVTARTLELILVYPPIPYPERSRGASWFIPRSWSILPSRTSWFTPLMKRYIFRQKFLKSHISYLLSII